MMAGLSSAGLPLPVQFIGRYFAEARLFQIDRAWKRKTGADEKHLATSSDAMQPQVFADGCRLVPSRDAGIGCRRTALLTFKNTAAGREVLRDLRLFAKDSWRSSLHGWG